MDDNAGETSRKGNWRIAALGVVTLLVAGGVIVVAMLPSLSSMLDAATGDPSSETDSLGDGAFDELSTGNESVLPINRTTESGGYKIRQYIDTSGFGLMQTRVRPWAPDASLEEIAGIWRDAAQIEIEAVDKSIAHGVPKDREVGLRIHKAACYGFDGQTQEANEELAALRRQLESDSAIAKDWLYSVIYFQGVFALRQGEDENCILCRGESSCILPISPAAVHTNPAGSRKAIEFFLEYLGRFPDDVEARWLLNIAYMTLGEYPERVPKEFLFSLEKWSKAEFDIGVFRDVGHLVGLNRLNISGGAILEDFDNDGRFDVAFTNWYPTKPMAVFTNDGRGRFEDHSGSAGVLDQLGGLNCVQTDYNNDGLIDIFIPRGAWVALPMRPTLLRNDGLVEKQGSADKALVFTDVTPKRACSTRSIRSPPSGPTTTTTAGSTCSSAASGSPNRLYRNRGDGTFEDVAEKLGVAGREFADANGHSLCKGAAWIDYDNDDFPDLFLNYLTQVGGTALSQQRRRSVRRRQPDAGNRRPESGFSCWALDYDNDGWLDIFATSYDATAGGDRAGASLGEPPNRPSNKLYRNLQGELLSRTSPKQAGLDKFYATMGSNFGDFDNDGFLDFYLGTGDPNLATLVPNRMFKNVAGKRFAEITASPGTGQPAKGSRRGAAATGTATATSTSSFRWAAPSPATATTTSSSRTPARETTGSPSSWSARRPTARRSAPASKRSPLARLPSLSINTFLPEAASALTLWSNIIGLGQATSVATLEIHWPTSGTTQTFHDIPADRHIEITEFDDEYRVLDRQPVRLPAE